MDAFRERFHNWKAREECTEDCDLDLVEVFLFKNRREVHLRLTETYQLVTAPVSSPEESDNTETNDKGKERSREKRKDKSSVLGGILGIASRAGNSSGGGKTKQLERHIDLILQMPASGNTENVYFLERVKRDKDDTITYA